MVYAPVLSNSLFFMRSVCIKIACFEVKLPVIPPPFSGSVRRFGVVFLCVTLCVLFLAGCDILKGLGLSGDEDEGGGSRVEEPAWKGELAAGEEGNPSIKTKFGVAVDLTGTKAVDAAFHKLKSFIGKGGLEADPPVISLGDWIDLEDGLSVENYPGTGGVGGFTLSANEAVNDLSEDHGRLGRLIVVGINSFRSGKGYTQQYVYPGEAPPGHVVFQFQNVPVTRQMNTSNVNEGGYAASEMRKYLVPVDGFEGSGNFLA
jgi:hypothetical protein